MKTLIIALILLFTTATTAQVSIGVYQDAKLLVVGDSKGNNAGTPDIILELTRQGHRTFAMKAVYEFADLKGGKFYRYSVHGGWILSPFDKWEYSIYTGIGAIHRGKEMRLGGVLTYSLMGEIDFKATDKLRFGVKYELLYRSDLKALYDSDPVKPNFSVGVKYKIFN